MSKRQKINVEIIYSDDDYIILNKPACVPVVADKFSAAGDLCNFLKEMYGDIFVVHHLDDDASGVISFARNESAYMELRERFDEGDVLQVYLALVVGHLRNSEGRIDLPLSEASGRVRVDYERGRRSITEYRVIKKFENYSLVEAKVLTERLHQVRVHFSSVNHPLAIDPIYGSGRGIFLSEIKGRRYKSKEGEVEKPIMDRSTLHLFKLGFFHFRRGEFMNFEARLPKDFSGLIRQLEKYKSL